MLFGEHVKALLPIYNPSYSVSDYAWYTGNYYDTLFATLYPPNVGTSLPAGITAERAFTYYYPTAATSRHPGGVQLRLLRRLGPVHQEHDQLVVVHHGQCRLLRRLDARRRRPTPPATHLRLHRRPGRPARRLPGSSRPATAARSSAPTPIDLGGPSRSDARDVGGRGTSLPPHPLARSRSDPRISCRRRIAPDSAARRSSSAAADAAPAAPATRRRRPAPHGGILSTLPEQARARWRSSTSPSKDGRGSQRTRVDRRLFLRARRQDAARRHADRRASRSLAASQADRPRPARRPARREAGTDSPRPPALTAGEIRGT